MIIERLVKGWTVIRVIYLAIGLAVIFQAINYNQWLGIFLGAYLSFMGLFGFGCAGGNCFEGNCDISKKR